MRKLQIIHPLLFTIYPVLFLYAQNADITPLSTIIGPLLIAFVAGPFVWFVFNLSLKDRMKSALLASVFLILFFSFGHLHSFIHSFFLESEIEEGGRHVNLLVIKRDLYLYISVFYVLILEMMHFWLKKTQRSPVRLTKFANVMAVVLCVIPLTSIGVRCWDSQTPIHASFQQKAEVATKISHYKPDIYYIILDGYAREDILRKYYDYDNSDLLSFLRQNGFEVMSKSRSNFFWTFLSLSSSLNMEYVTDLAEKLGKRSTEMHLPYQMIRNNEVAHFLRSKGYRFVHFDSTWGATMVNPFADMEINCGKGIFQVEFYRVLMESSWLKLWESPVSVDLASCHLANFHKLAMIPMLKGPKFVFAHFIPPHHPYLFDRRGTVLRHATISNQLEFQKRLWGEKDKYIDQLYFINQKVKTTITSILEKSERPPIIILQSDHGPQIYDISRADYLQARFSILAAFRLPGSPDIIDDSITPVNIFRILFNYYFDADFELLPNEYYFSSYEEPYNFEKVSLDDKELAGNNILSSGVESK